MEMAKERNDKRAKFIKEMRIKLAWSQEHLAEVAGVSSRTIQRIEKEGIGEFETLMGLALAFDIDVTELMQISESEKIDEKLQKHFEGITFFTQMTSGKGILDLGFGTLGIIPGMPQVKNKEEALKWAESSEWMGLEIKSTQKGAPNDTTGVVEFIANYKDKASGTELRHHETSLFQKQNDEWKFKEGNIHGAQPVKRLEPKVGRNDPCSCGSGKKFKKCHGA